MLFKNLIVYHLKEVERLALDTLDSVLAKRPFHPAGPNDRQVLGWVAPLDVDPDQWVRKVKGAYLLKLKIEQRAVPPAALRAETEREISKIELQQHRKIGKKEAKDIKEQVEARLLPRTFSKESVVHLLLDPKSGFLWIDQGARPRAELAMQALREALGSLSVKLLHTQLAPETAMTNWLAQGAPDAFALATSAKLKSPGNTGAQVTVARHDLAAHEVMEHLKSGKLVNQLALEFDQRIGFTLTQDLKLQKLALLEILEENLKSAIHEDAHALFDATLLLIVEEVRLLIVALIRALGGQVQTESEEKSKDKMVITGKIEEVVW